VQKHLEATGENIANIEFGTDDLISQLLFVIAKCYCETGFSTLYFNVAYIQQFHLGNLNTTAMGYTVFHFEAALRYLIEWGEAQIEKELNKSTTAPTTTHNTDTATTQDASPAPTQDNDTATATQRNVTATNAE